LQLSINTSKKPAQARAILWMQRSATPFGNFLSTSLRSYLGDGSLFGDGMGQAEAEERRTKFLAMLSSAIDAAEPLVKINQKLLGEVHGSAEHTARYFSRIPFDAHEITNDVVSLLKAAKTQDKVIHGAMSTDNSLTRIDITTTLGAPHDLLVIESLLKPIADQWAQAVATNHVGEFWSKRRAKPLREFIAAPQALIHCLVRGWYTASILGKIDKEKQPIEIDRANHGPACFPQQDLSSHFTSDEDAMARVLESLSIAYATCSEIGELSPLDAYIELRELGSSNPDGKNATIYMYKKLNQELIKWIETGEVETSEGWATGLGIEAEVEGDSREAQLVRAEKLVTTLKETEKDINAEYAEMLAASNRKASALTHTELWRGLKGIIIYELTKLKKAAEAHQKTLLESSKASGKNRGIR